MIQMHDLKSGDIVNVDLEGALVSGSVLEIDREGGQICVVTNDDQESWYAPAELFPIRVNKDELENLQFSTDIAPDPNTTAPITGDTVTYVRGPFSIEVHDPSNFEHLTLFYRNEAPRVFHHGLALHELQNHYLDMTKVHLVDRAELEE
jgi:hypothetical protein